MVIALLTDFGTSDYFVGAMKGVILSIDETARIVDITHDVRPQDIRAAGFILRSCYREFPGKTIFVTVVDPGVGSDRRPVLAVAAGYYFIAPDNGLLEFLYGSGEDCRVYEIADEKFYRHPVSRTFHGRDIFAPAAAHLARGIRPAEFGPSVTDFVRGEETRPVKAPDGEIEAEVIHIDRFGNLITNLTRGDLPERFYLVVGGTRIDQLQTHFSAAGPGEVFMIFGSAGLLEIAAFQDSARNILKTEVGEGVRIYAEDSPEG